MAKALIYYKGEVRELPSVNTPDYKDKSNVIINPTASHKKTIDENGAENLKIVDGKLVSLTEEEKQQKIDAGIEAKRSRAEKFQDEFEAIFTAFVKVVNLRLPADKKITKQELVEAIRSEVQ